MCRLSLLFMMLLFSFNVFSQESIYKIMDFEKVKEKEVSVKKQENVATSFQSYQLINLAGVKLKKSAKYQYAALGLEFASTALMCGSLFFEAEYVDGKIEKNNTQTAMLIGGGVCSLVGLFCYIKSISLKLEAGKVLSLYPKGAGLGLTLAF